MININIIIAIIGGTITITGFFITRYLERKKDIEFQIRDKKIPIYEEFLLFYFKVVHNENSKSSEKLTSDDMKAFFRTFNQKALIWFPQNTLILYIEWRKKLIYYSENNNETLLVDVILTNEELIKLFRKDIGHENSKLQKGAISSLSINGIQELIDKHYLGSK